MSQCPTRALHIGEVEGETSKYLEESNEEVYEVETNLVEEYKGDDDEIYPTEFVGVIRCILAQTKEHED